MLNHRGMTLIEVLMVTILIGAIAAFGFPRIQDGLTKQSLRSARAALVTTHAKAKANAVQTGSRMVLYMGADSAWIMTRHPVTRYVTQVGNGVDLHGRYGVRMTTTRDSLVFDARGLGSESGTTTIYLRTGTYVDSVVVTSVGRVIR